MVECRLRDVDALIRDVEGTAGAALVMTGDPGSGRSTMLEEVAGGLTGPSVLVRIGTEEAEWEYSGIFGILTAIDARAGTSLRDRLPGLPPLDPEEVEPYRIAAMLTDHLLRSPLPDIVLLVDDADQMDRASARVLAFLARRLAGTGLAMVLVMTPQARAAGSFRSLPTHALAPLDLDCMIDLARQAGPADATEEVLVALARAAEGNPAVLMGLQAALPSGVLVGEEPIPVPLHLGQELSGRVHDELADLPTESRRALQILSASPYTPLGLVTDDPAPYAAVIDDLVSAGWVRSDGVRRTIVRAEVRLAVYWEMSPAERTHLHEQLMDRASGVDEALRAWHMSCASPTSASVTELIEGAARLVDQGMVQSGIELAERAGSLHWSTEHIGPLISLVDALTRQAQLEWAGRYEHRLRRIEHALPLPPDLVTLRVMRRYYQDQRLPAAEVARTYREFRAEAPMDCLLLLTSQLYCRLARWEIEEARLILPGIRSLRAARPRLADAAFGMVDLYADALAGRELPGSRALVEMVAGVGSVATILGRMALADVLSIAGRSTDARDVLTDLFDRVSGLPPVWREHTMRVMLQVDQRAQQVRTVREDIAWIRAETLNPWLLEVDLRLAEVRVLTLAGSIHQATDLLEDLATRVAADRMPLRNRIQVSVARAVLAIRTRRPGLALLEFGFARDLAADLPNPQLHRFHGDMIELMVAQGRREEARALLDELTALGREMPSQWTSITVRRCQALCEDGERSLVLLRRLLGALTGPDQHYERARTYYSCAVRAVELGRTEEAREAYRISQRLFQGLAVTVGAPDGAEHVPLHEVARGTADGAGGVDGAGPVLEGGPDLMAGAGVPEPEDGTGQDARPVTAGEPADKELGVALGKGSMPIGVWQRAVLPTSPDTAEERSPDEPVRTSAEQALWARLTDQEEPVVELVLRRYRNRMIAENLYISVRTVELRLTGVYRKFGVSSRSELQQMMAAARADGGGAHADGDAAADPTPSR